MAIEIIRRVILAGKDVNQTHVHYVLYVCKDNNDIHFNHYSQYDRFGSGRLCTKDDRQFLADTIFEKWNSGFELFEVRGIKSVECSLSSPQTIDNICNYLIGGEWLIRNWSTTSLVCPVW